MRRIVWLSYQIILALAAVVAILEFSGVKSGEVRSMIWPHWSWMLLAAILLSGSLYSSVKAWKAPLLRSNQIDKITGVSANAALLFEYANDANYLNGTLESCWQHWHGRKATLVHPLAENPCTEIQDLSLDDFMPCRNELDRFRILYWNHVDLIESHYKGIQTPVTRLGKVSNAEYLDVRRVLKEHEELLRYKANGLLETVEKIRSGRNFGLI